MPIGRTAILSWCHLLTHLGSPQALLPPSSRVSPAVPLGGSKQPLSKSPCHMLRSQLCRQGQGKAKKHPILLLFISLRTPGLSCRGWQQTKRPGLGVAFPLRMYWRLWAGECQHVSPCLETTSVLKRVQWQWNHRAARTLLATHRWLKLPPA